jgi:hypothetical protein
VERDLSCYFRHFFGFCRVEVHQIEPEDEVFLDSLSAHLGVYQWSESGRLGFAASHPFHKEREMDGALGLCWRVRHLLIAEDHDRNNLAGTILPWAGSKGVEFLVG